MRKYLLFAVILLVINGCNKPMDESYKTLQKFSEEFVQNSSSYTQQEWIGAELKLDSLEVDISQYEYDESKKEHIDNMLAVCRLQFALRPVTLMQQLRDSLKIHVLDMSEYVWAEMKSEYDSLALQITRYSYSEDRSHNIELLEKECMELFGMKPYYEFKRLHDDIITNARSYSHARWTEVQDSLSYIATQIAVFDYSQQQINQINKWKDECKDALEQQHFNSYVNSAKEIIDDWLSTIEKKLSGIK